LQRNTIGIIRDRDEHHRAWSVLDRLMSAPHSMAVYPVSNDPAEAVRRLVDVLSPTSFEHLCVDLLRLERPELVWLHVGGSGDGGADGLGFHSNGFPAAILQCKLRWPGSLEDPRSSIHRGALELYVASLDAVSRTPSDAKIWGPTEIGRALVKHARSIPLARTLHLT
jgi:hypothetical protein